ncbi:MAG: preprotein translocase subunit SecG [Xanthobacteraceae bacterium]|jgi:preprotein translocase subunit SecG|nr:preprotein translocase subunit SecG [Xanthobacteraceae bacterium]
MLTVIIVIHLLLVLALIGVVLLQKSEGGGLGIGGGGGFLTTRGSSNVLTKTTAILAGGFFLTSLFLSIIAGWGRQERSIIRPQPTSSAPGEPAPAPGGNILDALKQKAPSGPQVPQSQ